MEEERRNGMSELITIQKNGKLNEVYALGDIGPGGARHEYEVAVRRSNADAEVICRIQFQKGPRFDPNSTVGVCDQDLLEIVRDRLRGFQSGELATRETAIALSRVEEALLWLNKRIEDRIERCVLGTMEK